MTSEISAIAYFAPIAAFLIVFVISFAIFAKTKLLGENNYINIFVSFLIAAIFVSAAGARQYVQTIIPWIAILLITLVFFLAILGFIGEPAESLTKGVGIAFIILLGLVFLISAFFVFSDIIIKYLPGPSFGMNANPNATFFLSWLYSPRVVGAAILIAVSAVVSWILAKAK